MSDKFNCKINEFLAKNQRELVQENIAYRLHNQVLQRDNDRMNNALKEIYDDYDDLRQKYDTLVSIFEKPTN